MREQCKRCLYFCDTPMLIGPHCHHINSAIVPGWWEVHPDGECPEYTDKEKYCNKLKEFFEANMNNFIQNEVKENKSQAEQREFIVTHGTPMLAVTADSIIAKINFIDNYYGNLFLDAIKQGQNIIIKPYGHAEHDDKGNIKNFKLVGFNIQTEKYDKK